MLDHGTANLTHGARTRQIAAKTATIAETLAPSSSDCIIKAGLALLTDGNRPATAKRSNTDKIAPHPDR